MSVCDPRTFPYVRIQNYADGVAPAVLSAEFYNPVQDYQAALFGGAVGQSWSMVTEEFLLDPAVAQVANGRFGQQLTIRTASSANANTVSAPGAGAHGVWQSLVLADPSSFVASDTDSNIGTADFLWSAKVRFNNNTSLPDFANRIDEGFVIGMDNVATGLPAWVMGKDSPNWNYLQGGAFQDSGVAWAKNTWYTLRMFRVSGQLSFTIQPEGAGLTAFGPFAYGGAVNSARRYFAFNTVIGATINAAAYIDVFARIIGR